MQFCTCDLWSDRSKRKRTSENAGKICVNPSAVLLLQFFCLLCGRCSAHAQRSQHGRQNRWQRNARWKRTPWRDTIVKVSVIPRNVNAKHVLSPICKTQTHNEKFKDDILARHRRKELFLFIFPSRRLWLSHTYYDRLECVSPEVIRKRNLL